MVGKREWGRPDTIDVGDKVLVKFGTDKHFGVVTKQEELRYDINFDDNITRPAVEKKQIETQTNIYSFEIRSNKPHKIMYHDHETDTRGNLKITTTSDGADHHVTHVQPFKVERPDSKFTMRTPAGATPLAGEAQASSYSRQPARRG